MLTPAVRALAQVLRDIRDGRFAPDAPRSAMFPEARALPAADASSQQEADEALEELDSSSASSGNEEANIPFDDAVQSSAPRHVLGPLLSTPEWAVLFRNQQSGVVHLAPFADAPKFLCGRTISSQYPVMSGAVPQSRPRCGQCFRHSSLNDPPKAD